MEEEKEIFGRMALGLTAMYGVYRVFQFAIRRQMAEPSLDLQMLLAFVLYGVGFFLLLRIAGPKAVRGRNTSERYTGNQNAGNPRSLGAFFGRDGSPQYTRRGEALQNKEPRCMLYVLSAASKCDALWGKSGQHGLSEDGPGYAAGDCLVADHV